MIVQALGVGIIAGLILNAIYRALNHGWPEKYFGSSASVDLDASRNLARYAVFRLSLPAVVAAISVNTLGGLGNQYGQLGVIALAVTHFLRNCQVIADEVRKPAPLRLRRKMIFQSIIMCAVSVSLIAGYFLAGLVRPLTPEPRDLLLALWTAAAAGLGAAYVTGFVLKRADFGALIPTSLNELDQDLIDLAQREAKDAGIDAAIPIGVMISENIQRPLWTRQLDRTIARRFKKTEFTQGVMQVRSAGPLSDRDSVIDAIRQFADEWRVYSTEPDQLWTICKSYNQANPENLQEAILYVKSNLPGPGS